MQGKAATGGAMFWCRMAVVELVLCLTTCPDRDCALRIAHTLVDERLAACVNILGDVTSIYRWKGAVESAGETQLLIKSTRARCAELQARLVTLHPYDVPEFLMLDLGPGGGSPEYLAWIDAAVARSPDTDPFR